MNDNMHTTKNKRSTVLQQPKQFYIQSSIVDIVVKKVC